MLYCRVDSVDIGEFNYFQTFVVWVGLQVIVELYSSRVSVRGGKRMYINRVQGH